MKRKINIWAVEIVLLFILSCILIVVLMTGFGFDNKVVGVEKNISGRQVNIAEQKKNNDISKGDTREQKAVKIYEQNKDCLILVNKDHKLSENYDGKLMDICEGRLKASERLYEALNEMLRAGAERGYSFFIASAYRDPARQAVLLNNDVQAFMNQGMGYEKALKKATKQTMPAGYSEHETGLAMDIMTSDNLVLDENQEKMAGNKWMRKNCWKYGFILRYPKDKEKITKISYEPWHFRYVGKAAAKFMHKNQLTLEEFIELTK